MSLKELEHFKSKNPDVEQVQSNLRSWTKDLVDNPLLGGHIVKGVEFKGQHPVRIPHKLGREPQGYFSVRTYLTHPYTKLKNLVAYSNDFTKWQESGTCAVTKDSHPSPEGYKNQAMLLDNTGGANTDYRYIVYKDPVSLAGRTFSTNIMMRAPITHLITTSISETGVAVKNLNSNASLNWWATGTYRTMAGGGTGEIEVRLYPGQRLAATDVAHFYGVMLYEMGGRISEGYGSTDLVEVSRDTNFLELFCTSALTMDIYVF